MTAGPSSLLAVGSAALGEGDWRSAREAFSASLDADDSPEAHAGLAESMWWLGDLTGAIAHRQEAYVRFRRRPDPEQAFLNALLVILDYQGHMGNYVASSGWLARARRLVDEFGLDDAHGWLALAESNQDVDPVDGERLARLALTIARESSDTDLELCALASLGTSLVEQGRVAEGIAHLDEAMAGCLGGEVNSRSVVVFASCNMMVSCIGAADVDRAVKWVRAADRFTERFGCPFLYAECRTVYGNVLVATGNWARAERELRTAISSAEGSVPEYHAQALATLADLRLAQGRLAEARRLVSGIEGHPWAVPVVARLHLMAGRLDAAEGVVSRRLRAGSTGWLEQGRLRELLGEVVLARGEVDEAVEIGAELSRRGEELDCQVVALRGRRLAGRALLAGGDVAGRGQLESAADGFAGLGLAFEAAICRRLLGELLPTIDPKVAEVELMAAWTVFDDLGASGEVDRAASALRALGASPTRRVARHEGELTPREDEVLALLAEGLSNPEIADRLYISRKTVEHHVRSVLAKLGVRNRAEAAAEAVRRRRPESAGQ